MQELLKGVDLLFVASGKKILEFNPQQADEGEMAAKIFGRSGNLRAPTLRVGRTMYVGYNQALYEMIVG